MMNWIKDRVLERTSLDGVMLIVLGVVILIAGLFAKFAAYGAIHMVHGLFGNLNE